MPWRVALPAKRRHLPLLAGGATWFALALLVSALLYYVDAKGELEAATQARVALGEARDEVDRRLETALAVPETLAIVIGASERIDEARFRGIASRLIRANPSIRSVAVAPDNVITLIHPVRGNEPALGLRYADNAEQYPAVEQAMRARRTVIAGPIRLVQGGTGLASRTPVFFDGPDGPDTRYWGLVSVTVDIDELFVDIARIARRNGLSIAVRRADPGRPPGELFSGNAAVFASSPVSTYYPIPGGGRLQLAAAPLDGWSAVDGVPAWIPALLHLLALAIGLAIYRLVAGQQHDRMLASRDALTGLLNRKTFDHRLSEAMLGARVLEHGLVLIDLDDFKPVNDTHGHSAGDAVLQQVAQRLQHFAAAHDATAYRIGGDEFALLVRRVADPDAVADLARRALAQLMQPVVLDHVRSVVPGASVGVAVFPVGGQLERAGDVFDRADRALYRCKGQGGGCVHMAPLGDARTADA